MRDFDAARDRILMGQPRDSLVLSDLEKARVAYHEGGHAVLAYVLTHADPLLKVSIIPTGLALGVTQQLPTEERHIYPREYIEDALVRAHGRARGRDARSTATFPPGRATTSQRNTELARKMVREWGMSERVGPMAWGSQGMVFLGEDLMHTRDYSEDTSRVVDEEVARILREQEARATAVLREHRAGLEAVAHALLEFEKVDGAEIGRLVDVAYGKPVHGGAEGEEKSSPSVTLLRSPKGHGTVGIEPALDRGPADRGLSRGPAASAKGLPAARSGMTQGRIGIPPTSVVCPRPCLSCCSTRTGAVAEISKATSGASFKIGRRSMLR